MVVHPPQTVLTTLYRGNSALVVVQMSDTKLVIDVEMLYSGHYNVELYFLTSCIINMYHYCISIPNYSSDVLQDCLDYTGFRVL